MNCEWYEEQISALIDHELDDERSAQVFLHLASCATCRAFMGSIQKIRSAISESVEQVPASLDARVRAIPKGQQERGNLASLVQHTLNLWKHRLAIPAPAFALLILLLLVSAATIFGLLRTAPARMDAQSPSVVYIMSLSPIEVQAQRIDESPRVH